MHTTSIGASQQNFKISKENKNKSKDDQALNESEKKNYLKKKKNSVAKLELSANFSKLGYGLAAAINCLNKCL